MINNMLKLVLNVVFPELNLLDIRCIDIETAKAMQEQMRREQ